MAAQNYVVKPLHGTIQLKFELSRVIFAQIVGGLHSAHFVHPGGHSYQSLVVARQVGVVLKGLLHVTEGR